MLFDLQASTANMQVWLPWVVTLSSFLGIFLLVAIIMFLLSDPAERSHLSIITSTLGISVVLCSTVIIPADIYNTSHSDLQSVSSRAEVIKIFYYVLFSMVVLFTFIVSPFSFFYSDSLLEENTTLSKRMIRGTTFSIAFIICLAVVFVLGLIIGTSPPPYNGEGWMQYFDSIGNSMRIENAIALCIFVVALLGFVIWLTYTSFGMSSWTIGAIKGFKRVDSEIREVENDLKAAKTKEEILQQRSGKSSNKQISEIQEKESYYQDKLSALKSMQAGCHKYYQLFVPLKIIVGFVFFGISVAILISLAITLVNKLLDSGCGFKCGLMITSSVTIPNPLDLLLTYSSEYYPLDTIIFFSLVSFLVLATIIGLNAYGIRILWIRLFGVHFRRTPPQALVLASLFLVLAVMVLNFEVLYITPQYSTFGSRKYDVNGTLEDCSFSSGNVTICPMTQIASLYSEISIDLGFFGLIFYGLSWGWIAAFVLGVLIAIVRSRKSNIKTQEEMLEDDDFL